MAKSNAGGGSKGSGGSGGREATVFHVPTELDFFQINRKINLRAQRGKPDVAERRRELDLARRAVGARKQGKTPTPEQAKALRSFIKRYGKELADLAEAVADSKKG